MSNFCSGSQGHQYKSTSHTVNCILKPNPKRKKTETEEERKETKTEEEEKNIYIYIYCEFKILPKEAIQ